MANGWSISWLVKKWLTAQYAPELVIYIKLTYTGSGAQTFNKQDHLLSDMVADINTLYTRCYWISTTFKTTIWWSWSTAVGSCKTWQDQISSLNNNTMANTCMSLPSENCYLTQKSQSQNAVTTVTTEIEDIPQDGEKWQPQEAFTIWYQFRKGLSMLNDIKF